MRIQSLSEVTQSYWKGVIYSAPGVGKTSIACTDTAKVFVFDIDKSLNTAKQRRNELKLPQENVQYATINSTADFEEASKWLLANLNKFNRVSIDSATELQRIIVREVCKKDKVQVPGREQWNLVRELSEGLLVDFRNLPIDVVYTAHETFRGNVMWTPSFDGKFAVDYARHVDYIARYVKVWSNLKTEENPNGTPTLLRSLLFGPCPDAETKDRSKTMQYWEEPNLDNILARMRQAVVPQSLQTE